MSSNNSDNVHLVTFLPVGYARFLQKNIAKGRIAKMDKIEFINKLEDDLILLKDAEYAFQIEICKLGLDNVGDEVWKRGADISRAIISLRKNVSALKLEAGNYPIHTDIPSEMKNPAM